MYYLWLLYEGKGKGYYLPDCVSRSEHYRTLTDAQAAIGVQATANQGVWKIEASEGFIWDDGAERSRPVEDCRWFAMHGEGKKLSVFTASCRREDTAFRKVCFPRSNRLTIGGLPENTIQYSAPTVSRNHSEIVLQENGVYRYVDHSSFGSYVNGCLCFNSSHDLAYGDVITILPSLQIVCLGKFLAINNTSRVRLTMELNPIAEGDVVAEHSGEEAQVTVQYHRAPRHMQQPNTEAVEIEPPLEKDKQKVMPTWLTIGPSITMVLPMLVSALVAQRSVLTSIAMMGTSSALAVMWGTFNRRYQNEQRAQNEEERQKVCKQYYAEMDEMLSAETERERKRLLYNNLSVEECLNLPADSNNYRLWERMPSHDDFLSVRLGLGEKEFPMPLNIGKLKISLVDDPLRREPQRLYDIYHIMHDVPMLLNIAQYQIIGVLGNKAVPWLLQSMVVQIAAMHSYHDVRIAIIHDETDAAQWHFAKWLPHVFASDDRTLRMVVSEENAVAEVFSHIDSVLAVRADQKTEWQDAAPAEPENSIGVGCIPWYIVICTDPKLLEGSALVRYLTSPGLGFTIILQTPAMELLPKECRIIIESKDQLGSVYHTDGRLEGVRFERMQEAALEKFAKSIAPFRIKEIVESSEIPSLVTFLETYNVRSVEELDLRRFWSENHAYQSVKTILGYKAGNAPFVLDISFKNHGPHGLIAGTTGAGKSVLLQTFILSLAINYSPKEVQFILIDYKGGGTSEDFRNLPHAAGIIDSLQGERMIYRALASIKGEILRREQLFKEGGVNDIDDYMRLYNSDPAEESLAHLIIIVDEFAELKKEQPEFMNELVSAARVGRSLGLHLVLATQKPSNSVSNEIEANTRFRICLRVASKSDSSEMLKRPEAAYLKGMGRCYVQVGNNEVFEQVQTSFSGAEYAPGMLRSDEEPRMLNEAGQPIKFKKKKKADTEGKTKTELTAVLEHIIDSCERYQFPKAAKLWLDELERELLLTGLQPMKGNVFADGRWPDIAEEELLAYYGMADDINTQRHLPAVINISQDRNELIVGLSGSGKTTMLQTLAVSLALRYSPRQVVIYAFSLTSHALGSLRELPHVGDIVYEEESDEQIRLIEFLNEESERRKKLFSERGTDNFTQYNRALQMEGATEDALPAVVVLVDRVQQLRDWENNRNVEKLQIFYDLLRAGAGQGIYFVMTAFSRNELPGKYQSFVHGISLQMNDRMDYADALAARVPPDWGGIREYPGRGVIAVTDKEAKQTYLYEIQTAVYGTHESDALRAQKISQLGKQMRQAWRGRLPKGLPRIPEKPMLSEFLRMGEMQEALRQYDRLPLGYIKKQGETLDVDLRECFTLLISGPKRSGKTNLIKQLAVEFAKKDAEIYLIGDMELQEWGKGKGMNVYEPGEKGFAEAFDMRIMKDVVQERSKLVSEAKKSSVQKYRALMETFKPVVILIDDLDTFIAGYETGSNLMKMLPFFAESKVSGYGIYTIASISHAGYSRSRSKEPAASLAKAKRGIALQGKLTDCDPFDTNVPFAQKNLALPLGEGLLILDQEVRHIVLPECDM